MQALPESGRGLPLPEFFCTIFYLILDDAEGQILISVNKWFLKPTNPYRKLKISTEENIGIWEFQLIQNHFMPILHTL